MKTRTYLFILLVASLVNAVLPPLWNLAGTMLLCMAILPLSLRMDREESKDKECKNK